MMRMMILMIDDDDDDDDVDSAVIAVMYSDDDLSHQTNGVKPRHTRRGQLRLTRKMPAIAKLVNGAITASSHTAEALAKTVARARSYMKLVGCTLSDTAHIAKCRLKEKQQKAATLLSPDNPVIQAVTSPTSRPRTCTRREQSS